MTNKTINFLNKIINKQDTDLSDLEVPSTMLEGSIMSTKPVNKITLLSYGDFLERYSHELGRRKVPESFCLKIYVLYVKYALNGDKLSHICVGDSGGIFDKKSLISFHFDNRLGVTFNRKYFSRDGWYE